VRQLKVQESKLATTSRQSLPRRWQNVIWREWRNCEDEEYAKHLFDLVADEPAGWWASATIALLGTYYGVIGGLLVGLIATNWEVRSRPEMWRLMWPTLQGFVFKVGPVGSIMGLLIRAMQERQLSWRSWLAWLTPVSFESEEDGQGFGYNEALRLSGWLIIHLFLGLTAVVTGLAVRLVGWLGDSLVAMEGSASVSTSTAYLVVGLFIGLFCWWIVGMSLGGLEGPLFGPIHGLIFGLISWLGYGLCTGLGLQPIFGLSTGLFTALSAVWGACIDSGKRSQYTYRFRSRWFWWHMRPFATETETVLRQMTGLSPGTREVWTEPLRRLDAAQQKLGAPDARANDLKSDDWVERFTARSALVALGGEAVKLLIAMAQDKHQRRRAAWLLRNIARETTVRLKRKASWLLCPRCLVNCAPHRLRVLWRISITYYGCRACGQSRKFLERPGKVVAVLDAEMADEQAQQDGVLRVNWLRRKVLFDFDEVEIVQALDRQVQSFLIQVGNDTDVFRQRRYRKMRCTVAEGCQLSKNTLRALKGRFPRLEPRCSDG
jgi:RNase P subunit RPR2